MIGQRVNNYEITRLIGSGAMGAVYEAQHPIIRRKVAVKVLQNQLIRDPMAVQRFFEEARLTSTIRHPHIVEIIDVGTLPDGVPYLIMELLEGETLATRLERVGRLDITLALNFALQAAAGLEAAHAHGVIHRDLKPDHLFLMPDQRLPGQELLKVLDFGIAKLRGTPPGPRVETHSGTVMGTPLYMSPEQCSGVSAAVDQRTDIYALGVILYEALCGQPPFMAAGIGDILMMHTATSPVSPSVHRGDLPARVEQLVLTALAKRAEHRFASMADFAAAVRAARTSTQRFVSPRSEPIAPPVRDAFGYGLGNGSLDARQSIHPSPPPMQVTSRPLGSDTERTATESSPLGPMSMLPRSKGSLVIRALLALLALGVLVLIARGRWQANPEVEALPSNAAEPTASALLPTPHVAEAPAPPTTPPAIEPVPSELPPAVTANAAPPKKPIGPVLAAPPTPEATALHPSALPPTPSAVTPPKAAAENAAAAPVTSLVAPSADGYLSLDSAPWAEVYLGNQLLGSTPLLRVPLAPGKHELTLKNPELHRTTTYVVEVKAGGTVSRFVGWEQEGR